MYLYYCLSWFQRWVSRNVILMGPSWMFVYGSKFFHVIRETYWKLWLNFWEVIYWNISILQMTISEGTVMAETDSDIQNSYAQVPRSATQWDNWKWRRRLIGINRMKCMSTYIYTLTPQQVKLFLDQ